MSLAHVCELLWSHVGTQDILHLRRAVRSCPVIMTTTRLCSPVSSFFSLSFNYLCLPSAMLPSIRSVDHRARRWARTGLTEEQSHPSILLTQSVTLLITLYGPNSVSDEAEKFMIQPFRVGGHSRSCTPNLTLRQMDAR